MTHKITFTIVEHPDPPKFQVWQHLNRGWFRRKISQEVRSFETREDAEACIKHLALPWRNVFYYDEYGKRDESW